MPSPLKPGDRYITIMVEADLYARLQAWMKENEFRQITPAAKVLLRRQLKAEGK